jgi:hypothetical protein
MGGHGKDRVRIAYLNQGSSTGQIATTPLVAYTFPMIRGEPLHKSPLSKARILHRLSSLRSDKGGFVPQMKAGGTAVDNLCIIRARA